MRSPSYNDCQGEPKEEFACKPRGTIWVKSTQAARLTHVSEAKSNSRWAIRLDDDDDDANHKVRTTVPLQNRATATSKTQESLLKTQYL